MELKVFFSSFCSLMESRILGMKSTKRIQEAHYVVNPFFSVLLGKWILINLPLPFRLGRLSIYNKILSRFPIPGKEVELYPYEVPKNSPEVPDEDYSLRILTKSIMNQLDKTTEVDKTNYLLGTQSDIDGYMTAVGYKLCLTDLTRFKKESTDSNN